MSSSNQKRLGCVAIVLSLIGLLTISACIGSAAELRDIPRERTLIIGLSGRVATTDLWNPFTPGTPMSNGFQQVLIESLFYLNYETGQLMPWLATSYEYNEDCTEVTIKIRPGVEWSDGVPFTSRDVVFTLDMLKENAPKLLFSSDVAQYVASAEALDDETVFIKLNQRSPMFVVDMFGVREYNALPIVPEHIWK
ncbi:MAG: ABC transporter substrate-binding protein, partial [Firmicutes bacterium]|nr:ABC transporter substrate-binding protein [Bacillota bacterium]